MTMTSIEKIPLRGTDLAIARLGFGCWQLGGHGWQGLDQREIELAAARALERGLNFFDTADVYGLGASEEILGDILKSTEAGKQAVVATKFSVRRGPQGTYYDNSKEWMTEALEASLKRLKRDVVDLYQVHWHDGKRDLADLFGDLEDLRKAGKIRSYGISNIDLSGWNPQDIPAGLASFSFEYSLVRREHLAAIEAMEKQGLAFLSWGSLSQGLLGGKYTRDHTFDEGDVRARPNSIFAAENWDYYEPILAVLDHVAKDTHRTMAQVALRWILDEQPRSVVLAGIKSRANIEDNLGVFGWHLTPAQQKAFNNVIKK